MKITIVAPASLIILSLLSSCSSENKDGPAKPINREVNTSQTHTQKIVPPSTNIPEPVRTKLRPLSLQQRFSGALQSHNRIRAKHQLPPLKWSNKLVQYSQEWANHLARGNKCQMYHRPQNALGENLYRSSAIVWTDGRRDINPVSIKQVVKAWTDEEKWYDYSRNHCQAGQQCGHYTQIVWKNTTEVGCAMQVCGDKSQTWVCSYSPPGNYVGVRPY